MTKNTLSRVTRNLGRMQPVWCKNDYGCTSAQNEVSQVGSSFNNVPSNKKKILAFIKFVVLLTEYLKHVTMMLHSIVYKLLVILNAKSFAFFAILGKSLALYSFIVTYTTENNFCCVKFQGCHIC